MLRRTITVLLFLVSLLVPVAVVTPPASANGYDLHACDDTWSSPANNSFAAVSDPGMTAYSECPAGKGMVVRNVYDGGTTSALQGAYLILDAPAGTTIASLDFDAGYQRHNCSYNVALVASGPDLGGHDVWGTGPGESCDTFGTPGEGSFFPNRWSATVGSSRLRMEVRCGAASCPRNGVAAVRLRNVVVHMSDDTAPMITSGRGALVTSAGWLAGTQAAGFDATDGSGVKETAVLIDGKAIAQHSAACDFTQRSPCPPGTDDETFPTSGFGADGDHVLTLRATDAAGNVSTVSRTVHIDNTPPDAPSGLSVDSGDGWRQTNSFDVHWTAPAPQSAAPIAAARWQLCPFDSKTGCVGGTQPGAAISSLSNLQVPGPGAWTLSVWLADAAGNQDQRLAAPPVTLRFDDTSPTVTLNPLSADDPTLIVAPVTDSGSGIASGTISVRRAGAASWTALPTSVGAGTLTARLDDEHLPDGEYELQAVAQDAAGNQRVTTTFSGGQPAQVTLPLRLKTRLRAGVVERSGHHVRLVRAAYAGYGRLVRVRGRLTTPEGNPMQGVPVEAYSRVRDATSPPRLIATVTTSKTGRFSFLVRRGPSRTIRIRYAGAAQIRSATQQVVLNVRAATSIRPNRHSLVNGETVRFTGRVRTGRIPTKGKLVALEVLVRGRWRTFATTHASRRGRWRYDYRFDGTRGLQQYRFRAALPREAGYPFAAGGSRIVRVRVRGV